MRMVANGLVWNSEAIDYSQGVSITDPVTGRVYTQKQAEVEVFEIRRRLVNKGNKIGVWVVKEWTFIP
jgi:hypothetical protein